ncbi:MAG: dienelactone hydrolase family protein [Acidobacteria bacterium]|nr:dienelactone hydrolase family protein [Acidobacteriota bacterium]
MSEWIQLKASDGHELAAYVARPEGDTIGALVLVQEIFGVNPHIRSVADGYAKDGFVVIAPALFDRYEKGVELKYEGEDMKKAFELYQKLNPETALLDVAAAYDQLRAEEKGIGVIGYCYGGLMSWLSATRGETLKMQPSCVVGYYAGGIGSVAKEEPSCPVMLHFGEDDDHIGKDQVEAVRSAHPEVEIFMYKGAGHGFNCDARGSYNSDAAKLARERSLKFLKANIA